MQGRVTTVFFRDDDVGVDEDAYIVAARHAGEIPGVVAGAEVAPSLQRLLALFAAHRCCIDLAVIPYFLNPALAAWLAERERRGEVSLLQHGWIHREHGCREFGPCRSYDAQCADLARGKRFLEEQLGECFTPIFVPPSNKYDENTLLALGRLGFVGLSAGFARSRLEYAAIKTARIFGRRRIGEYPISHHPGARSGLLEYSISIDFAASYAGGGRSKTLQQLKKEFARARRRTHIVGVMLHHWTLRADDDFNRLEAFIQHLRQDRSVVCSSLKNLAVQQGRLAPSPQAAG